MGAFTPKHHSKCRPMTEQEAMAWYWPEGAERLLASVPEEDKAFQRLSWMLVRWRVDPVCFAVEALRVKLAPYQVAILLDLADAPIELYQFYGVDPNKPKRQVLIPSGHGMGKTRVLAIATWWHKLTIKYTYNLCTAPTATQLTGRLWDEIRKMYRRLKKAWPMLADQWEVQRDRIAHIDSDFSDWATVARTAREEKPEGLQGAHAMDDDDADGQLAAIFGDDREESASGGIMVVIDEASGVSDAIREVLKGALSEEGARLIAPANPTRPDGWFAEDCQKTHRYAIHNLDCRDSNREKMYQIPYRDTAGRVHKLTLRGFVRPSYWEEILEDCDGDDDHDVFRVRVKGMKPRSAFTQCIKTHWVDEAMARPKDEASQKDPIIIGLDFGLFSDKHSLAVRQGFNMLDGEEWLPPDKPKDITLKAADLAIEYQERLGARYIIGDSNGVGRGAMEYLSRYYQNKKDVTVIHFNSGKQAHDKKRYYLRRDEMWHKAGRSWVSNPRCHLIQFPRLKSQLTATGYHEDAKSRRIKAETKSDMKKRGFESGNIADSLLHTLMIHTPNTTNQAEKKDEAPSTPVVFQEHFNRIRNKQNNMRIIR
ncbi:hypothetical protein NX722_23530 [Endozoicomonas gorgoniicola]|uniref:Terminase n=1 Tax=Endozoicomonas gorgoniicola TaxID=1234144 RepID=A0ABT3N2V8_9GAMM|nr:hypothetical protein [Endozoicomonas gorgoniicola]MCW7555539.1 hypothetical protein [Endozoicomonas gorgoniicola]